MGSKHPRPTKEGEVSAWGDVEFLYAEKGQPTLSNRDGEYVVTLHLVFSDGKPFQMVAFSNDGTLVKGWMKEGFGEYLQILV